MSGQEYDILSIYFENDPLTPVSFKVPKGFCIVAPYQDMYQFVDVARVQRAFNWRSIVQMIVLRDSKLDV